MSLPIVLAGTSFAVPEPRGDRIIDAETPLVGAEARFTYPLQKEGFAARSRLEYNGVDLSSQSASTEIDRPFERFDIEFCNGRG